LTEFNIGILFLAKYTRKLVAGPGRVENDPLRLLLRVQRRFAMNDPAGSSTVNCPVCDGSIQLGASTVVSELLKCRECGSDLEVTSLTPPQLQEAPMEEEDWGE
jgi:alpha-aminoadipate/glutamate carrier protein LysW